MNEYCIEIRIRKRGFRGYMEYLFNGIKWQREFECRKSIPELEQGTKQYLDGVIADIETIDNFN